MVIPRSYPRAAGIQSEISKSTVTRIAGFEVNLRRQIDVYNKDIALVVDNIKREQICLRKSMAGLRRKRCKIKQEKQKELEKQQAKLRAKLEKQGNKYVSVSTENSNTTKADKDGTDSESGVSDEESYEVKPRRKYVSKSRGNSFAKGCSTDHMTTGVYTHSDDECVSGRSEGSQPPVSARSVSFMLNLPLIGEEQSSENQCNDDLVHEDRSSTDRDILDSKSFPPLRPPKSKKQTTGISFSDLLKAQHSNRSKTLFRLVDKIAKNNGISDDKEEIEERGVPDIRESVIHKGATYSRYANEMLKTVSAIYPIRYGYDIENERGTSDIISLSDRGVRKTDMGELDGQTISTLSIPKSDRGNLSSDVERRKHRSKISTSLVPNNNTARYSDRIVTSDRLAPETTHLKPDRVYRSPKIRKDPIRSPIHTEDYSSGAYMRDAEKSTLTWANALGLLKGVHSMGGS